jgi:hypothetical protein
MKKKRRTGMASELCAVTIGGITKRVEDVFDQRGCGKYNVSACKARLTSTEANAVSQPRFSWTFNNVRLTWTYDDNVGTVCFFFVQLIRAQANDAQCRADAGRLGGCCGSRPSGPVLAVIRGRSTDSDGALVNTTTLEIAPAAHISCTLPHVLVSALVAERRRLARFRAGRRGA